MSSAQIQGDNLLQYPTISSSSDSYDIPFVSKYPIGGRPNCRSARRRIEFSHPEMIFQPIVSVPNINPSNNRRHNNEEISTRYATLSVALIFLVSITALYVVYQKFPEVTEEEKEHLKIPWNIEDAKQLGIVLNRYKGDHYYHVMSGVFLTYIFLQTFAIPGSLFLSILSGYLFPFYVALVLVCTCSMVGATLCFMLSQLLGRKLVLKYFPERASKWKIQVDKHKDNMFNYMVFLRVTPILPNWFINLSAPVIGVPLVPFALGTFVDKENLEKVTKYIPSKEQFQSEYKRQTKKLRTKLRKIF
ncbi:transmembrane protein 41 homolog isoform X2 [Sitophilus oryzae]|uniref:Transmembrane protein 41 homolog isoform X2 n=1 Tax=Sitophilus oryzae TaxID=7048 RepID=A0A6J2YT53_SITOR|nr:transmembrane protein 41 homolog isoform X2 [Sitophilus oryzae]